MTLKPLALLLPLALPACAQQAAPGVVPPMTFPTPALKLAPSPAIAVQDLRAQACPIGISVRAGSTPETLLVDSARTGKSGIHVRLAALEPRTMSRLAVSVLYRRFPGNLRLAGTPSGVSAQETFELKAADATVLERNLQIAGNIEIDRVRVLSITYTDGTTWKAANLNTCSIKPKPYTLLKVASR